MSPAVTCLAVVLNLHAIAGGSPVSPHGEHKLASLDTRGHWHLAPGSEAELARAAEHGTDPMQRCMALGLLHGLVPITAGPPDTACGNPMTDLWAIIRADPLMRICEGQP